MNAWAQASASDRLYMIVRGKLDFDATDWPRPAAEADPGQGVRKPIKAHLGGEMLTRNGFHVPVDMPVILDVSCIGPWCGLALPGETYIAFVEIIGEARVVAMPPCGGDLFPPSTEAEAVLASCMSGGPCPSP